MRSLFVKILYLNNTIKLLQELLTAIATVISFDKVNPAVRKFG